MNGWLDSQIGPASQEMAERVLNDIFLALVEPASALKRLPSPRFTYTVTLGTQYSTLAMHGQSPDSPASAEPRGAPSRE